ncbi:CatB-related O-acetyltransferase [Sulfobacillus sp. hq2]|uniref:CatB-related O-acetyltransferase n=1 Tax=Sulfobacillus TaxID=28033 RepID=UPI000CD30FB9|nr:CatB-related O-acetyltransferase [Sulfobacillus sp. hq2]POB11943.1 acetyltransferase [Sulfobacillus sp. hq2]
MGRWSLTWERIRRTGLSHWRLLTMQVRWRQRNPHNLTLPVNVFPIDRVTVGHHTYGPLQIHTWGDPSEHLTIGHYVSIARGVQFVLGGNHDYHRLSTYPMETMVLHQRPFEALTKGPIEVADDVWLGMDAMILSGVSIGQGAVVAARSVVTHSIPPYAIVAGNPARILRYRFPDHVIATLLSIDYSQLDEATVRDYAALFTTAVTDDLISMLEHLPRKTLPSR